MKMRAITAALMCLTITACQSVGMKGSPLWHMTASQEEKIAAYRDTCISYGFKYGTPEMSQCIAQESRDSRSSANSRMQAIQQMNSYNNRTINCTSTRTGAFVNTNCR